MRIRKFATLLSLTAGLVLTAPISAQAQDAMYSVQLNKTRIVHLPEPASAVVVGNSNVADVTVHSSETLFIVGRGYGDTNLIVMNSEGQTIMNADIHVTVSDAKNNIRIYNGSPTMRASYNCSPYCQPAPILGDSPDFIEANKPEPAPSTSGVFGNAAGSAPGVIGGVTEHEMSVEESNPFEIDANSSEF